MGSLRHRSVGKTLLLEPELVIGRGVTCALRLDARYVSAQHALLRWTGHRWALRDLASSNGTFVDGNRVKGGDEALLRRGARIAFGDVADEWELVDDSSPSVMVVPLDGGEPIVMEGDLLALPSADDPHATIYRGGQAGWCLEHADHSTDLSHLQVFQCAGRTWKFCCTEDTCGTQRLAAEKEVRHLSLAFSVSRDEQHVQLQMDCGGQSVDMGARACTYLLLTLARHRLQDERDGLPEGSCGWIDHEDLAHDPRMAPPQLNIDVFRLRRLFAAEGVVDAANLIERRPLSRQLRIAKCHVTIRTL
ncbi:MAG: FHA domain-containing protein [Myxococcota bacterium]|nr:FHA domain-containing protein [Myxococcota bacterium]